MQTVDKGTNIFWLSVWLSVLHSINTEQLLCDLKVLSSEMDPAEIKLFR